MGNSSLLRAAGVGVQRRAAGGCVAHHGPSLTMMMIHDMWARITDLQYVGYLPFLSVTQILARVCMNGGGSPVILWVQDASSSRAASRLWQLILETFFLSCTLLHHWRLLTILLYPLSSHSPLLDLHK